MRRISRLLGALALASASTCSLAASTDCADVTGTYTLVGEPAVINNALMALGGYRDFAGGSLTLSGSVRSTLRLSLVHAKPDRLSRPAQWTLSTPQDFRCEGTWLVLNRPIEAFRSVGRDVLVGKAIARFARSGPGSLLLEVRFKGQRNVSLYSYGSASVDLPLPWTRSAATDALEWPEGTVPVYRPERADLGDPERVAAARRLLGGTGLTVGDVIVEPTVVRAKIAAQPEALAKLEDHLRAAGVVYQVPESPVQSSGGPSFISLLLPQQAGASHMPSERWVEQELRRWLYPGTAVNKISCRDGICVAQLGLLNGLAAEQAVARLRSASPAFSELRLRPETERALSPSLRVVELQLQPR